MPRSSKSPSEVITVKYHERYPIEKLRPYDKNPRINKPAIPAVAQSIRKFGFIDPIIADETGRICCGHTRFYAARQLERKTVPVKICRFPSEAVFIAYNLADNRLGDIATFDLPSVGQIYRDLSGDADFGAVIDAIGFDQTEIDAILRDLDNPDKGDIKNKIPPAAKKPVTKKGDLWLLGDHRVACIDSFDLKLIDKLVAGKRIAMIATDPPYGMDLDTDWSSVRGKAGKKVDFRHVGGGSRYRRVKGDDKEFDPRPFFEHFGKVKEQIWWGADYYRQYLPAGGSWYVWDKRVVDEADRMFGAQFELAWSKETHRREIIRKKWAGLFGLGNQDTKSRVHPTQKPTEVYEYFFNNLLKKRARGIVLDMFIGSGTTIVAGHLTGRVCYGAEIDRHYCDVAIERWQNLTGGKAKRQRL